MGKNTPTTETIIRLIVLTSAVLAAPNIRDGPQCVDTEDEAQRLICCETSQNYPNISEFWFNTRSVSFNDSACLSLRMFKEMGFIQEFHIPLEKLSRFILRVQKGYTKVPYHNWDHGFAVLHFSFAVLKNCKYIENNCFSRLEGLALLTAAMCHDLDHPGTNGQYQEKTNSLLAQKHRGKGSILERHHIEKTFNILKDQEANFVTELSETDHKKFMDLISQLILATDLKNHFNDLPKEQQMAHEGFDGTNEQHRYLLRSVVISSSDLSDQVKDWETTRKVAKLINTEFFDQGDKEKEMGVMPVKMMDRQQVNIAEEQAKFISKVAMPLFRVLLTMCPETQGGIDNIERNLKYWQKAIHFFEEQYKRGREQIDILEDTELGKILKEE